MIPQNVCYYHNVQYELKLSSPNSDGGRSSVLFRAIIIIMQTLQGDLGCKESRSVVSLTSWCI